MADNGLLFKRQRSNAFSRLRRRGAIDSTVEEELSPENAELARRTELILQRARAANGNFDVPNSDKYGVDGNFKIFKNPTCHQGWKIHVPAPQTYELSEEYKSLFRTLQVLNVPHKYVYKRESMRDVFDTDKGRQAGKFLTIYPDSNILLKHLVTAIDIHIQSENFAFSPRVAGERPVGSLNIATVRYGSFTSPYILDPAKLEEAGANRVIENYVPDDRSVYKPDTVLDPFDHDVPDSEGWVPVDDTDVQIVFKQGEHRYTGARWHAFRLCDEHGFIIEDADGRPQAKVVG